jgi:hypothetical protein
MILKLLQDDIHLPSMACVADGLPFTLVRPDFAYSCYMPDRP